MLMMQLSAAELRRRAWTAESVHVHISGRPRQDSAGLVPEQTAGERYHFGFPSNLLSKDWFAAHQSEPVSDYKKGAAALARLARENGHGTVRCHVT